MGNLIFICTPKVAKIDTECEYIILLGGGIKNDGTLSTMPLMRVKKTSEYAAEHPEAKIVVTGGKGILAPCPEAPVLRDALVARGVSEKRILIEDKAYDTIENFIFSAEVIAADKNCGVGDVLSMPITVVTSGFHLARAERLARRMGFTNISGIKAPIPRIFVLNAYCREICSYIKLNLRILLTGKPEVLA